MSDRFSLRRALFFSLYLWICWASFLAAPAQATINPRPRVILTPTQLANVQNQITNQTPNWVSFKSLLDGSITRPPGTDGILWAPSYALAYVALQSLPSSYAAPHTAADYGNYAIALAVASMNYYNQPSITSCCCVFNNGPCSNTNPPLSGNDFINNGWSFAIVYDWTYPLMSASDKSLLLNGMLQSCNYDQQTSVFQHYTYSWGQGPGGNLYTGTLQSMLAIGYATFGDNPTDDTTNQTNQEISFVLNEFETNVKPYYNAAPPVPSPPSGYGVGGAMPEGAEYGLGSMQWLTDLLFAAQAGESRDLWSEIPNFATDVAYWNFYQTSPTTTTDNFASVPIYEPLQYGDQEKMHYFNESARVAMLAIGSYLGNSTPASYVNFWLNTFHPKFDDIANGVVNDWMWNLVYQTLTPPQQDYRNVLGTDYIAPGEEFVSSRSNWTSSATWTTFNSGQSRTNHMHQQAGHFTIYRNGLWMGLDPLGYGKGWDSSDIHNVLEYKGVNDGIWKGPATAKEDGDASITRYDASTGQYVYAQGTTGPTYRVTSGWPCLSPCTGDWLNVQTATREWVYLKPDYWVIFDRATFRDLTNTRFLLVTPGAQTSLGGVITSTNGTENLYLTPLFPTNYTETSTNLVTIDCFTGGEPCGLLGQLYNWRAEVYTATLANSQQMLNTIQTADLPAGPTPVSLIQSGNLLGSHIKDSAGDWAVVFSPDSLGANLTLPISYSILAVSSYTRHLIVNLAPNAAINVSASRDGSNNVTVTVSSSSIPGGRAMTTSTAGTLNFTEGTAPAASPCDLNSDGTVNIVDVQIEINRVLTCPTCGGSVATVQQLINAVLTGICTL